MRASEKPRFETWYVYNSLSHMRYLFPRVGWDHFPLVTFLGLMTLRSATGAPVVPIHFDLIGSPESRVREFPQSTRGSS